MAVYRLILVALAVLSGTAPNASGNTNFTIDTERALKFGVHEIVLASNGSAWVGAGGLNYASERLNGLDSLPFIARHFKDRNIDIARVEPDDVLVSDLNGRTGQRRPKLAYRNSDDFQVYHPNATDREPDTPLRTQRDPQRAEGRLLNVDWGKTVRRRVDLASAPGTFQTEWYRAYDGVSKTAGVVEGGSVRDFIAPWEGYEVALHPSKSASDTQNRTRFEKYSGPFAYGLNVIPPWAEGGYLTINFPEHLEYGVNGEGGILRHGDKEPRGHWKVSEDGRTAILDVESPTSAGVHVTATAMTSGPDRADFTIRIINRGRIPLNLISALYCHRYGDLIGFPQSSWNPPAGSPTPFADNFKHTYVVIGGKPVALAIVPTRRADADVKGAPVIGSPRRGDSFAEKHGGYIEQGIDAAIVAVTSLDGRRKMLVSWTPGKSMLSNSKIPCVHADPYYGTIQPGESRTARGSVLFTEASLEEVMLDLLNSGAGKSP